MVLIDVYGPGTVALGVFYVVLLRLHLAFTIFPFPVSTAQVIGEFWKIRRSATTLVALHLIGRCMNRYWRYEAPCALRRSGAPSPRQ